MVAGLPNPGADQAERLLVEEAQRDPSRFGELYRRHFERVYAFVAGRVGGRAEAEDLTSDVFQRALAGLPRYQWRGVPFAVWLFRIAANEIADRGRRQAREQGLPASDPPAAVEPNDLERAERQARLFRLVDRLPADQRRVIHGRFIEQRSVREIAQALGRSEGAVKQLQFRALAALRTRLNDEHA